jgi:hypothetical protein
MFILPLSQMKVPRQGKERIFYQKEMAFCLTCDKHLCSESGSKHDHNLRKKSEKAKSKEPFMKAKHIAAICDYCNSLIEGVRHKCTVCPGKHELSFRFKTEFLNHIYRF